MLKKSGRDKNGVAIYKVSLNDTQFVWNIFKFVERWKYGDFGNKTLYSAIVHDLPILTFKDEDDVDFCEIDEEEYEDD